jgi:hypothetical protein
VYYVLLPPYCEAEIPSSKSWWVFLHTIKIPCATNTPATCCGGVDVYIFLALFLGLIIVLSFPDIEDRVIAELFLRYQGNIPAIVRDTSIPRDRLYRRKHRMLPYEGRTEG